MTRFEFMTKLQGLLQDISLEERNAALDYYEDYFEDAGTENVDKIIAELGSPERVAAIIKSDLSNNSDKDYDNIEYTENGCWDRNIETDRYEVINSTENKDTKETEKEKEEQKQYTNFGGHSSEYSSYSTSKNSTYQDAAKDNQYNGNGRKGENNSSKTVIIILLCIFGIPVILPVFVGIAGGILGVAGGLLGVFVAIAVCAVALLIAGGATFVLGIISLFQMPVNTMFLCGIGLFSIGIGILLMILATLIWGKWLPGLIKGFIYLCKLPFKKRREFV